MLLMVGGCHCAKRIHFSAELSLLKQRVSIIRGQFVLAPQMSAPWDLHCSPTRRPISRGHGSLLSYDFQIGPTRLRLTGARWKMRIGGVWDQFTNRSKCCSIFSMKLMWMKTAELARLSFRPPFRKPASATISCKQFLQPPIASKFSLTLMQMTTTRLTLQRFWHFLNQLELT